MKITVKRIGNDTVTPALAQLLKTAKNPAPVMRNISERMLSEVQENIRQQGRPAWQPLSPKTLKNRVRRGRGTLILRDYGYLYTSITAASGSDFAQVTSNMPYARIQNDGGTIKFSPRSGTVRLRADSKGNLMRQGKNGKLAVFAKGKHKNAVSKRWTKASGWSVTIPARPYMVITQQGWQDIAGIITRALTQVSWM